MSRSAVWFIAALAVLSPLFAAGSDIVSWTSPPPEEVRSHWSAERLASAVPVEMAVLGPQEASAQAAAKSSPSPDGPAFGHPASPPALAVPPDPGHKLFAPELSAPLPEEKSLEARTAPDTGSSAAHFTSSRLVPLSADLSYPYRAVGRLFLQTPDGPASCSAAVVAPRLVLTAAHCVHSGSPQYGFYTQFLFVPAYRDGTAPFGAWAARSAHVPAEWATNGWLPHPADYALLEMRDLRGRRLGDVVGWLGVQTRSLYPNHVHMLGYPRAFDRGERMHQVTTASAAEGFNNTVLYGSDMTRGASGGPWIQNFGEPAAGQVTGAGGAVNRIVGVSSFTLADPAARVLGSSVPDERYTRLYTAACQSRAANCGPRGTAR